MTATRMSPFAPKTEPGEGAPRIGRGSVRAAAPATAEVRKNWRRVVFMLIGLEQLAGSAMDPLLKLFSHL